MDTIATGFAAFRADLAGIAIADDAAKLKLKSRDFFWFSPILKPLLDGKRAVAGAQALAGPHDLMNPGKLRNWRAARATV